MNISMSNAEKWEACARDDRMQSFKWLAIIGIVLLSALIQSRNANASEIKHSEGVSNNAALCATFRKQLSLPAPNGLIRFRIDESAFSDIDVTGGNLSSLLEGSCSLSREPANPCSRRSGSPSPPTWYRTDPVVRVSRIVADDIRGQYPPT